MLKPLFLATLFISPAAWADAPGDDMLKPDEVNTVGVSSNPANDSGVFIGGGVAFGQGRSSEGDSSPGMAYGFKFEPGYQMGRGSWGRVEIGGEVFTGSSSFRTDNTNLGKVQVQTPFGLLLKLGYGYSLGGKLFGVARLGVGPVMGKAELDVGADTYESDAMSGIATQIGWLMIMPMSGALDAVGGLSWTHMEFDLNDVESSTAKLPVDRSLIVNVPAVEVGLRVRL